MSPWCVHNSVLLSVFEAPKFYKTGRQVTSNSKSSPLNLTVTRVENIVRNNNATKRNDELIKTFTSQCHRIDKTFLSDSPKSPQKRAPLKER